MTSLGAETAEVVTPAVGLRATLAAALQSLRASSLFRPRPAGLEIEVLREGLENLLRSPEGTATAPGATDLAALLEETLRQRVASDESAASPAATAGYTAKRHEIAVCCGGSPDVVLYVNAPHSAGFDTRAAAARAAGRETLWAYHGTSFENAWSIINCGLVNAAQIAPDSLARTGSLFGKGIYLSMDPTYASNFAKPSIPLPCGLGRWSCLFLCEVAPGPMVSVGGVADSGSSGGRTKDAHEVPEGVIVAEDSEAVTVRCALIYRRGGEGEGPCTPAMQVLLAVIVIGAAALHHFWSHRRRWGIG